ncbi:TrkH family potassium uptake protein [Megamonas funiformis]|uniref:TrkH family potassium uptake protein n=1 Tax=Megamonas funiformis TaxID=437897 RepID=UPI0009FBBA00|nr:TrkH family potassium uptake protein [Megamonas funiformis]
MQQAEIPKSINNWLLMLSPYQVLVFSFLGLILVGAFLLMLPIASNDGSSLSFIDALFTATSAVCVTGLIVVDTGQYFSIFGQLVIIMLIQIGGFGVMTITTIFAVIMGKKIQLRSRLIVQESLNRVTVGGIVKLIKLLVKTTLCIEFIGGVLLAFVLYPDYGVKGIYMAFWHSISAFCNAGFDIFGGTNIFHYNNNPLFCLVIAFLIILGGIGYGVTVEVKAKHKWQDFSLHTKIVLVTTLILLTVGTVVIFCLEYNNPNTIGDWNLGHKLLGAFFLSTTSRTAGYTLLDTGALHGVTLFFIIILMFLGASPGSTAGGIKTTTIAIIFATVTSLIRDKDEVVLFKRRIEHDLIVKALAIFYIAAALVVLGTMCLCVTEDFPFIRILFEVTSAMATVGLSTGITADLTVYGKYLLILIMLIGRVGVLTFLMAISMRNRRKVKIGYPSERIGVG